MDDLPELPFEKVLSYLSLADRLKARAVSQRWYHKINCFKVNSLCYSSRPSGFIFGKSRWVSGAFAENFISSTRFTSFFDTYSQKILSNLKHLRLCDLDLNGGDQVAFARILNSFGQLEQLDIIRTGFNRQDVNLNLPMLTSLQLEEVLGIRNLTLEAPRLQQVKVLDFSYRSILRVEIVHGESVQRLLVNRWEYTEMKKLKNLQFLYINQLPSIDSTFLSSLQQLKEIHTNYPRNVSELFEQKQRSDRADLKIYLGGQLLNGPDDPAINAFKDPLFLNEEWLDYLAENRSRQADQMPFCHRLEYFDIEDVVSGPVVDLLKRFTDLNRIIVYLPVQNIERFLCFLKSLEHISELWFEDDQPQDLFDRLPEHCAVQKLNLCNPPSDQAFLFRLKHLIDLDIDWPIDSETVRRAFEELPLYRFRFRYDHKRIELKIGQSKQLQVSFDYKEMATVSDLNAAIELITGKKKPPRKE